MEYSNDTFKRKYLIDYDVNTVDNSVTFLLHELIILSVYYIYVILSML